MGKSFRDKLGYHPDFGKTTDEEPNKPRTFHLNRIKDASGVSGTGIVAVGVEFPSKKCCIEWTSTRTGVPGLGIYDNMEGLKAIHGHDGKTEVKFDDEEESKE